MNSKTNGKEDEDFMFLEQVLDKFYDFGNGPASKKKLKSQKKKNENCVRKRRRRESRLQSKIFEHLQVLNSSSCDHRLSQQVQVNQVEVVTFQDPRKKLKTKQTPATDKTPAPPIKEKTQPDQLEELNLEKARLEVHRFGITGYKKEQQRVFEQDRAIMLGARPPKKSYVNYKVFQDQIKEKKQKAKEEVQPGSEEGVHRFWLSPLGQVGRFKNGMLILSSKEIQKIKGKIRSK
ncbi:hypothetical protein INR49_016134 [Caranx melampygus]|nr:hypothetical protein INR49_016134 [Caranx melampygus]